jgi:hypothetical protein
VFAKLKAGVYLNLTSEIKNYFFSFIDSLDIQLVGT